MDPVDPISLDARPTALAGGEDKDEDEDVNQQLVYLLATRVQEFRLTCAAHSLYGGESMINPIS